MSKQLPFCVDPEGVRCWRRETFCRNYGPDFIINRAAARCGGSGQGFSATVCRGFLKEPAVQERIKEIQQSRLDSADIRAEDLLRLVKAGANADIADYYRVARFRKGTRLSDEVNPATGEYLVPSEDGDEEEVELIPPHELSDQARLAITGVRLDRRGRMTYTLSKDAMIQLGMRHLGMLSDKVDVTTNGESLNLTDDERAARVAAILDAARTRRDRSADS